MLSMELFARDLKKQVSAPAYKIVTSSTIDKNQVGLRVYKPEKCYNGYTLYNVMSPPDKGFEGVMNTPNAVQRHRGPNSKPHNRLVPMDTLEQTSMKFNQIFLIDMKGQVVHQWNAITSVSYGRLSIQGNLWYMTNNFPNMEQICDIGNSGVRELDAESNVITYIPSYSHHDFRILADNNLIIEQSEPQMHKKGQFADLYIRKIKIITREGKVLWSWNPFAHYREIEKQSGIMIDLENRDPFSRWQHNNTVQVLNENILGQRDKRFRKGNILFSMPHINIIGVIEYPSGKVVWAWGPGVLDGPHQPSMLENGNLLLFDNGKNRGWSRVLEIDPIRKEIVWEYHADPKESFFSPVISGVMQLPNGNRLICEGIENRIFEITQEGEVVWDYIDNLDRRNLGGIMRAHRYSLEYVKPLFSTGGTTIKN